ncbi:hypothetical protein SLEP1_g4512 [Rubroshorea leprosula]|uniref:Coenzyme Q-binding protein COQ10 START domain-containing protein n=1 Tax=Rubroshorea leprosula TaxID=152421 RepID=A0AAV5HPE1_9ROSI|nr:hypothetical protein SLEP1_g4512 [Rubroshorea leprosula]
MLAYPLPLSSAASSVAIAPLPSRFLNPISNKIIPSLIPSPPKFIISDFRPSPFCSNSDFTPLDSKDDDDGYYVLDKEPESTETLSGDGVCIEIKRIGRNFRKIRSKVGIDASLDTVWNIMTDYEKLADIIPGLVVSKLVEKKGNSARLYQIAQQNLPLGLKFNAKVVLDCYEKDLEISPFGKKRDIEFKMVEGDFQCFEGKWSIEQHIFKKKYDGFAFAVKWGTM